MDLDREWKLSLLWRMKERAPRKEWGIEFDRCLEGAGKYRVHLGVFIEPYLECIFRGEKTIESRFGARRQAPFGRVEEGDFLLLKRSGGPVCGVCRLADVWSYQLDAHSLKEIRRLFGTEICPQSPNFWDVRKNAKFATLMALKGVYRFEAFNIEKRDRRGWVVVYEPEEGS